MHIPDGYLDLNLAVAFFVLSISVLGYCMLKLKNEKLTALFGVVAGAIFVAQMLDWPIPGGTSAHYVGGALATILLGPYAGAIAMTIVLTIQAIVFGDGGITAWGANVWNMAIANVFVSYYVYRALKSLESILHPFCWLDWNNSRDHSGWHRDRPFNELRLRTGDNCSRDGNLACCSGNHRGNNHSQCRWLHCNEKS